MEKLTQQVFEGERALFKQNHLDIENCVFQNGESPLKESHDLTINQSIFRWKYPLWYCQNVTLTNSSLLETARSGIWYSHHLKITDSIIEAPKTFRQASEIHLKNVNLPIAQETFWKCKDISLDKVTARGDYFAFNSENIVIHNLKLTGNYCFDSCKNIVIHDSTLLSKDAFWNCENVTVYNSTIIGEYLAWNTKNITFVNCTIESLQGLCYIDELKMVDCRLVNTTLAFEYCSNIDAKITSSINSVLNPISGKIACLGIDELMIDETKVNPQDTVIKYIK